MKKFPKELYVIHQVDSYTSYLAIRDDGANDTMFSETTPVAVYELRDVGKVVVERRFEK